MLETTLLMHMKQLVNVRKFSPTVESNFVESKSCVLWWFFNNGSCIKNVITKAVLQTVENDPPIHSRMLVLKCGCNRAKTYA